MHKALNTLATVVLGLTMFASAAAQDRPEIALDRLTDAGTPTLEVMAPDLLGDDGEIADRHSAYGEGVSPAIGWSAGPEGTESYVLILQDPIAARNFVVLHWVVYNIPADVTMLPEGIAQGASVEGVEGAMQAPNISGALGYAGPRPPAEDPAHNYHFQVFALDTTLDLPQDADLETILGAMEGHVLAAGELVGDYSAPGDTPQDLGPNG